MFGNRKNLLIIATASVVAFVAMGCSSTRVLSTWKAEGDSQGPVKKVLIVGVSQNEMNRRLFEDGFASALTAVGVDAVTSYSKIPGGKEPSKDEIKQAAQGLGINRVLITHMLGVENRQVYHPPVSRPAFDPYYYGYGMYYPTVYGYVHEPGYYTSHEYVKLESNLYETDSEKLIWSAASETVDPRDIEKVVGELCRVLVDSMKKDGLVQ